MKTYTYASKIAKITIFEEYSLIKKIEINSRYDLGGEISELIKKTIKELDEYFEGVRRDFTIPVMPIGTDFELAVLSGMKHVSYGETVSYKELAISVGYPEAVRAVATVCRKNKLPIIYPCHRVIKSNGDYGKYSGGNDLKRVLIELEIKK